MEKIHKRCPHCAYNKQSIYVRETEGFGWGAVKYYSVICDRCRATGPEDPTPEGAWKCWDVRKRKSNDESRSKPF